jgi:hypothetical protein
MAEAKLRLCLLLEGTSAMSRAWSGVRLQYIEPLLRFLDKDPALRFELALIVFQTRTPYRQAARQPKVSRAHSIPHERGPPTTQACVRRRSDFRIWQ